jgi:hypothetical protein
MKVAAPLEQGGCGNVLSGACRSLHAHHGDDVTTAAGRSHGRANVRSGGVNRVGYNRARGPRQEETAVRNAVQRGLGAARRTALAPPEFSNQFQ